MEDLPQGQWASGFWDGASYELVWSSASAKDRTGILENSVAAYRVGFPTHDPSGSTQGTTYVFADSDVSRIPASGDYLLLRKIHLGGTNGGAAFGSWETTVTNGGAISSELSDLPPPPTNAVAGPQCVRLTALTAVQQATLRGRFDTLQGFILLDGQFRLAFKAKGVGGQNRVLVGISRGASNYVSRTVQLTDQWADYTESFAVHETNGTSGAVTISFAPANQSEVLLDDVSLRQTDSDPGNPTEFRDEVVEALRGLSPGILRYVNWQDLGNSLDNELAPVFARKRSAYSAYSTTENNLMPGLHEFLVLCEHVQADPWYSIPSVFSTQEVANLMEYLGGDTNTVYGALRARLGHAAAWTGSFARIHLEFGNENWNNTAFRGGCFSASVPCGNRAIKSSPYYASNQVQRILGGQAATTVQTLQLHNASPHHDTITMAPYMASRVDSYADVETLFGALFAEPEWWTFRPSLTSGFMRVNYTNLLQSSRPVPLSIYEVNLHTTSGGITQPRLDDFTPSVGAAIAVADHMLLMLRELGCRDQCFFSLPGHATTWSDNSRTSALWGAVLDMGKTNRKRPHYFAMQLLNDVLEGDMMQTVHAGDDPTWSVANVNRINTTNAHHVQSYAFANGAERALVVFNLHRTNALEVQVDGPLAPTGAMTWVQLTSAHITDNNESSNVVGLMTQEVAVASVLLPPFSMNVFKWTEAPTSIPGSNGPAALLDEDPLPGQRFYRLGLRP